MTRTIKMHYICDLDFNIAVPLGYQKRLYDLFDMEIFYIISLFSAMFNLYLFALFYITTIHLNLVLKIKYQVPQKTMQK